MKTNTPSTEYKTIVIDVQIGATEREAKLVLHLPAWLVNGQPQSILERN